MSVVEDPTRQLNKVPKVTPDDVMREFYAEATTSMRNIKPGSMAQHFAEWVDRDLTTLEALRRRQLKEYAKTHEGRIKFHLFRLLSDERKTSQVERDFGLAFLDFSDEYFAELEKQDNKTLETLGDDDPFYPIKDKIVSVLSAESYDSAMFWTFAPYIYKHLRARGIGDAECLKRIMRWATTGNVGTSQDGSPTRSIHLEGLRESGLLDSYYLTKNPKGATHLFTDKEAERIVDEILLK